MELLISFWRKQKRYAKANTFLNTINFFSEETTFCILCRKAPKKFQKSFQKKKMRLKMLTLLSIMKRKIINFQMLREASASMLIFKIYFSYKIYI
jgi:hypothetical protein